MFLKEDVILINKMFDNGNVINHSSLEYAMAASKQKSWIEELAYLTRAILIDHVFEEGNKRTAAAVIVIAFDNNMLLYDKQIILKVIIQMLKKNITDIKKIRRMITNAIR